jgi:hypothetical protein
MRSSDKIAELEHEYAHSLAKAAILKKEVDDLRKVEQGWEYYIADAIRRAIAHTKAGHLK